MDREGLRVGGGSVAQMEAPPVHVAQRRSVGQRDLPQGGERDQRRAQEEGECVSL